MTNEEILAMLPKAAYFTIAPTSCCYRESDKQAACDQAARLIKNGYCPEVHVVECLLSPKVIASYPKTPMPKVGQVWSCNRTFSYHTIVAVGRFEACMQHDHSLYLVQNERFETEWTLVSEPKP